MKKSTLITAAIIGVLSLGGGTAYATGQIARSNAIGEETARNFAYIDAGLSPEDAEAIRTEFDFEKGRFVYEIDFIANGMKYEYTVDSSNGKILDKETEALPGGAQTTTKPAEQLPAPQASPAAESTAAVEPAPAAPVAEAPSQEAPTTAADTAAPTPDAQSQDAVTPAKDTTAPSASTQGTATPAKDTTAPSAQAQDTPAPAKDTPANGSSQSTPASETIGIERAKEIALQKAGFTADQVTFSTAKLDRDDGRQVYDIEFYVSGKAEYEYEIDAVTGNIIEESIEALETSKKSSGSSSSSSGKSSSGSSSNSSGKSSSGSSSSSSGKSSSGSSSSSSGKSSSGSSGKSSSGSSGSSDTISVADAKSIALKKVGLSSDSVVFSKAKLERDDGKLVYEIEFYVKGKSEYDFEIDAYTGSIIDMDVDDWDDD